jgi:hypothetical protein
MLTHPKFRLFVKILSVLYVICLIYAFGSYIVGGELSGDFSSVWSQFLFVIFFAPLRFALFVLVSLLVAIFGTMDLYNQPRSYFAASVTLLNWLLIVMIGPMRFLFALNSAIVDTFEFLFSF